MANEQFLVHNRIGNAMKNPGEIAVVTQSLVSIMIPCCGMLEYTKLCVPSVLRHSRPRRSS